MKYFKIEMSALVLLISTGVITIAATCSYCRHAYTGGVNSLGECSESNYGETKEETVIAGKCMSGGTATCTPNACTVKLWVREYECSFSPPDEYYWVEIDGREVEVDDCI